MKLSVKCACGAAFEGEAEKGALQTPELIDAYRQWMETHADHVAPSLAPRTP